MCLFVQSCLNEIFNPILFLSTLGFFRMSFENECQSFFLQGEIIGFSGENCMTMFNAKEICVNIQNKLLHVYKV